jgi:hypothetical protein
VGEAPATGDVLAAFATVVLAAARVVRPEDLLLVVPGPRREIRLDADDRLDVALLRHLEELVGAEHVAVITHRDSRHPLALDLGEQLTVLRRAVQHGVLGVHV